MATKEKPVNYLIVLEPVSKSFHQAVDIIRKQNPSELEILTTNSATDATQLIHTHSPCIAIFSIETSEQIVPALAFIKSISDKLDSKEIKLIAINKLATDRLTKMLEKLRVSVVVNEPIPTRTLMFKLLLQIKALDVIRKQIEIRIKQEERHSFKADSEEDNKNKDSDSIRFSQKKGIPTKEKFVLNQNKPSANPSENKVSGANEAGRDNWQKKNTEKISENNTAISAQSVEKEKKEKEKKPFSEHKSEFNNATEDEQKSKEKVAKAPPQALGKISSEKEDEKAAKTAAGENLKNTEDTDNTGNQKDPLEKRERKNLSLNAKEVEKNPSDSSKEVNKEHAPKNEKEKLAGASLEQKNKTEAQAKEDQGKETTRAQAKKAATKEVLEKEPRKPVEHAHGKEKYEDKLEENKSSPEKPQKKSSAKPLDAKKESEETTETKSTDPLEKRPDRKSDSPEKIRERMKALKEMLSKAQSIKPEAAKDLQEALKREGESLQEKGGKESASNKIEDSTSDPLTKEKERNAFTETPLQKRDLRKQSDLVEAIAKKEKNKKDLKKRTIPTIESLKPMAEISGPEGEEGSSQIEAEPEEFSEELESASTDSGAEGIPEKKKNKSEKSNAQNINSLLAKLDLPLEQTNTHSEINDTSSNKKKQGLNNKIGDGVEENIAWAAKNNAEAAANRSTKESTQFKRLKSELTPNEGSWIGVASFYFYFSADLEKNGISKLEEVFPLWVYFKDSKPKSEGKFWVFEAGDLKAIIELSELPEPIAIFLKKFIHSKKEEPGAQKGKGKAPAISPRLKTALAELAESTKTPKQNKQGNRNESEVSTQALSGKTRDSENESESADLGSVSKKNALAENAEDSLQATTSGKKKSKSAASSQEDPTPDKKKNKDQKIDMSVLLDRINKNAPSDTTDAAANLSDLEKTLSDINALDEEDLFEKKKRQKNNSSMETSSELEEEKASKKKNPFIEKIDPQNANSLASTPGEENQGANQVSNHLSDALALQNTSPLGKGSALVQQGSEEALEKNLRTSVEETDKDASVGRTTTSAAQESLPQSKPKSNPLSLVNNLETNETAETLAAKEQTGAATADETKSASDPLFSLAEEVQPIPNLSSLSEALAQFSAEDAKQTGDAFDSSEESAASTNGPKRKLTRAEEIAQSLMQNSAGELSRRRSRGEELALKMAMMDAGNHENKVLQAAHLLATKIQKQLPDMHVSIVTVHAGGRISPLSGPSPFLNLSEVLKSHKQCWTTFTAVPQKGRKIGLIVYAKKQSALRDTDISTLESVYELGRAILPAA